MDKKQIQPLTLKKLELYTYSEHFVLGFISKKSLVASVLANWMNCLVEYSQANNLKNPTIIEVESPHERESPRRVGYLGDTLSPKKIAKDIAAQLSARG